MSDELRVAESWAIAYGVAPHENTSDFPHRQQHVRVLMARIIELEAALREAADDLDFVALHHPYISVNSINARAVLAKGATIESEAPCTSCGHLFATHLDLGHPTKCAACDCTGYVSATTKGEAP